jgi:hypothetical protein
MEDFEPLIGEWQGEGEIPIEPPMKISVEATLERLGEFVVFRSVGEPADVPDSVSIIGGAPVGEPQPMHYFDSRGVERLFMMALEGSTWMIWRALGEDWNGPQARASTSASSARSRPTARRSRAAGSAAWAMPATTGRSTFRSPTFAGSAGGPGSSASFTVDGR